MWSRIASRGSRTRHIANEDSDDARLTRDVVQSVMNASRASTAGASSEPPAVMNASRASTAGTSSEPLADGGDHSDSEEAWTRELEREMEQGEPAESDDLQIG